MSWLYRSDRCYHPLQSLWKMLSLAIRNQKVWRRLERVIIFSPFLRCFHVTQECFSHPFELGEIMRTTPKYVDISFSCSIECEALVWQNPVSYTSLISPWCYEQSERKLLTCLLTFRNSLSPLPYTKQSILWLSISSNNCFEWQWMSLSGQEHFLSSCKFASGPSDHHVLSLLPWNCSLNGDECIGLEVATGRLWPCEIWVIYF